MVSASPLPGDTALLPPLCHGFCGRYKVHVNDSSEPSWSDCGPCRWGNGAINHRVCIPCQTEISTYDWLFLIFMAVLPLLVHCFYVHMHIPRNTSRVHELCEHLCCGLECLIASIAAVLVFPPRFSFIVWGCARSNIKEWYPEFYNPIINHVKPMRCSYEIVFPLYSFPFIYLIFLLCAVLLFRSILYIFVLKRSKEAKAFYYALISIPKIAIVHAILAGVLYQSFPYIIMLCSLCANAVHLAIEGKVSVKDIAKIVSTSPKHMTMLTVNMMLLAFSLLAISAQKDSSINLFSLLLVPVPPIFYMTTVGISHPSVLSDCDWMVYVVIISCLINLVFSSVGDLSSNYRSCTNVCRRTYSCPPRFDSCLWCSGHCFRCRYGCMWKSVDQFAEQGELVPQFHGKWPFIAIDFSAFNLVDVIIQEPASFSFSLLNLYSFQVFYKKLLLMKQLENHRVWLLYTFVGMLTWSVEVKQCFSALVLKIVYAVCPLYAKLIMLCSAIYHARDCWFTEYLDYFSAFAFILFGSYISLRFILYSLDLSTLRSWNLSSLYGILLFVWFTWHVYSMAQYFDYGYNMRCCISVSLFTTMMYLMYTGIRWQQFGRFSRSDRVLLLMILWTNFSVIFETFDFSPVFWIFDSHSLFHAATIPLPFFLSTFLEEYLTESKYQLLKGV